MSSKERQVSDQVKEGVHLAHHASPVRKIREVLSFLLCLVMLGYNWLMDVFDREPL
jgi:hypothetical protein